MLYGFGGLDSLFGGDDNDTYRVDIATDSSTNRRSGHRHRDRDPELYAAGTWWKSFSCRWGRSLGRRATVSTTPSSAIRSPTSSIAAAAPTCLTARSGRRRLFRLFGLSHSRPGASDVITVLQAITSTSCRSTPTSVFQRDQPSRSGARPPSPESPASAGGRTLVEGDVDGDAVADSALTVLRSTRWKAISC